MSMATETQLTTFHISLNVSDLGRSIEFYQTLFNTPAAKRRADYAKFELADPPLVLSLEPCRHRAAGCSIMSVFGSPTPRHLSNCSDGWRWPASAASARKASSAVTRGKRSSGCRIRTARYGSSTCSSRTFECAGDARVPETVPLSGRFASPTSVPCTASDPTAPTDAFPPPGDWEHRLGSLFPRPLPFADGTLQEVRLRGTFNVPCEPEMRRARLAECLRVLRRAAASCCIISLELRGCPRAVCRCLARPWSWMKCPSTPSCSGG